MRIGACNLNCYLETGTWVIAWLDDHDPIWCLQKGTPASANDKRKRLTRSSCIFVVHPCAVHIVFCDMHRISFTCDVRNPLLSAWQPSVDGGKHAFLEQVRFPRPTPRRLLKSGREPFYSRAGIIFCNLHFFRLEARKFSTAELKVGAFLNTWWLFWRFFA